MTRLSEAAPAPPYVRDLRDLVARALCAPLLVAIAATLAVGRSHAEDTAQLVAVGSDDSGISLQHRYGSPQKGYITEFGGSGGAWIDYDMDGWLDLFLVNGLDGPVDNPVAATIAALRQPPGDVGHRLFRSHRGSFVPVPEGGGAGDQAWGNGAATADVDSDGYPELFVTAIGTDRLYRNNGDGSFDPWRLGVEDEGWGASAAFTDWDGDGALDLYVTRYIDFDPLNTPTLGDRLCTYRGEEVFCGPEGLAGQVDLLYLNRLEHAGTEKGFVRADVALIDPEATYSFALVASDCDADGDAEIYVANDSMINQLYRRDEGGQPVDEALFSGAGYSGDGREQAGMSAASADYDGDGRFDLFVSNFQNDNNSLYRNLGGCVFDESSEASGLARVSHPYMGWAALFIDIDGDADQDLFVANGHIYPQLDPVESYAQRNHLFFNRLRETGVATFEEIGEGAPEELSQATGMQARAPSRSAFAGDYDNDADIDLLVTNLNEPPVLLRNDGDMAAAPLRLTLVGRSGNRSAYGARVTVRSGSTTQHVELHTSDGYLGASDRRLLVFLPSGRADALQIVWPGGAVTELVDVEPGSLIVDELYGVVARRAP